MYFVAAHPRAHFEMVSPLRRRVEAFAAVLDEVAQRARDSLARPELPTRTRYGVHPT